MRIDAAVKAELDRLQGQVQAETGRRLSQSELLRRLLRFARARESDFLRDEEEGWRPPTTAELARLRQRTLAWGGAAADASHVDDVLYGDER